MYSDFTTRIDDYYAKNGNKTRSEHAPVNFGSAILGRDDGTVERARIQYFRCYLCVAQSYHSTLKLSRCITELRMSQKYFCLPSCISHVK